MTTPVLTPHQGGQFHSEYGWTYETYISGGAGARPSQSVTAVIDLIPGTYEIWSGEPPISLLEPVKITVTGEFPGELVEPAADVTVHEVGTDSHFEFHHEGEFRAGPQVIKIVNESGQPHTMKLFKASGLLSNSGELTDELVLTLEDRAPDVYASSQSSGTTTWLMANLSPEQQYILACFVPDIDFNFEVLHAQEGMATVVDVISAD